MSTIKCLTLLVLAIACCAQSVSPSFDDEHNPPGVRLTIETTPQNATYHFSDAIRFTMKFTSDKANLYTADLGGGSAAGASYDFVIQGRQWQHQSIRGSGIRLPTFVAARNADT